MLSSEWYNKQCIHKNWQSYNQINRGTICAKELPFRVQPFRGVNCGLIPSTSVAITHSGRPQTTRYHHSTLMVFDLHLLPSQHSDAPQPTLVAIITHLLSLDPSLKQSAASSAIALTASLVILT